MKRLIASWPAARQLLTGDRLGLGKAAKSERSDDLVPRTATADTVVRSICPYCAVGCGQRVYVKDEKVVQIEGDPDSPISRGRLCPKGAASENYVNSPLREYKVRYRRPHGVLPRPGSGTKFIAGAADPERRCVPWGSWSGGRSSTR